MIQAYLRDSVKAAGPYRLPAQAIPDRKKDDKWKKDVLDQLETIGLRDLEINRARFEDAYRIVEGSYTYSDVADTSLFLSEVDYLRTQAGITENLEHYGFIEPIINEIVGEYIKEPNPSVVYADDPTSTNEYLRTRTELLQQRVMSAVQRELDLKLVRMGIDPAKNDFNSEEEKQQYIQQIQQYKQENIPKEVDNYINNEWKPRYIDWAESTMEQSEVRFHMDELNRDAFRDFLITGRCFRHWRMGHDYYRPERWSPLETFTSVDQLTKYPELSEYTGRIRLMSASQVLVNYGQSLSENTKKKLLRSTYYEPDTVGASNVYNTRTMMQYGGNLNFVPHRHHVMYENAGYLQEQTGVNLGYTGYFLNQSNGIKFATDGGYRRDDLIQVMEAYWVSYKRIGYLTYQDPYTLEIVQQTVTDDVLKQLINEYGIKQIRTKSLEQHQKKPEINTIVWDYLPEVRYGVKITKDNTDLDEDLYLYGDPIQYQLRGESSIYDTIIPVTGIVENTSLVSRLEVDQIEYSLALNMARDYMSKELGIFFLMDLAYLPQNIKDFGGEEAFDKWQELTRQLGIGYLDSTQARGTQFNQFQVVNMDLSEAMLGKFAVAEQIRRRAYNKIGLTPERMGMPTEQKSATGVVVTNDASYAQTGLWFDKFSKFQQRDAEMCINMAQWAQYVGKDVTVNYTDSDLTQQFIRLNDPDLPMRKFRIYPQNNSRRRSELETLKQTFFQDNTIVKDLMSMAEVVQADSVSKIIKTSRLQREKAELQQQLQQQEVLKQIEAQKQADMEQNAQMHEYDKEIEMLKGEISLREKAIVALGFSPDKDANTNQVPDVIDQLKVSLQELDLKFRQTSKERELRMKQEEMNRKQILEQQKNDLKRQELQTRKQIAENQLQVAKTNKNRYDTK